MPRDSPDAVACIHTCTSSAGHSHGHQSLHPRACRLHMSGSLGSKSFDISVMLWHAKKWGRVGLFFFFFIGKKGRKLAGFLFDMNIL